MGDNFYDDVYYRGGKSSSGPCGRILKTKDREVAFLNKIFRPEDGTILLELGCGTGDYLKSLKCRKIDLWGIDISRIATDYARQKIKNPEQIICADAEKLPFEDAKFDYVTAWGTVEHFKCPGSILREIRRVLKPAGTAVIMVPNMFYYKFVWDALRKGKGPVRHQKIEHLCAFREWNGKIESSGLMVRKTEKHNKFNKPLLGWIRKAIPFYLSNHFVFFCEKG